MGYLTSSRSWISSRRELAVACLVAILAFAGAACDSNKPDTTKEGRDAILAVKTYKVPLGFTVADGVFDFLYAKKKQEYVVEMGDWTAYRRAMAKGKWRVVYSFTMKGSDLDPRTGAQEARFLYDSKTGKVEPENAIAREMMRLD